MLKLDVDWQVRYDWCWQVWKLVMTACLMMALALFLVAALHASR
jgi:hypothetical protein